MTTTAKNLESAKTALLSQPTYDQVCIYTNREALKGYVETCRQQAVNFAIRHCDAYNFSNSLGPIIAELRGFNAGDLSAAEAALAAIDASPEWQAAHALIHPLYTAVQELEATLRDEEHVAALASAKRQAEIDDAKAKALAEVESRFAEPEPSTPAEPEKPFRGRVSKSTSPELEPV